MNTSTVMPSNPVHSKLLQTVVAADIRSPVPQRTQEAILADVDLMHKAKAIREWLLELSGLIPRLEQRPNPYFSGTLDGLTLVCYYGGPSEVGCPYGGWAATGGGCLKNANWLAEATERLGLETLIPEFTNEQGVYGPVFRITRDLDGNTLPRTEYNPVHLAGNQFFSANVVTGFTGPATLRKLCNRFAVKFLEADMQEIERTQVKNAAYEDLVYECVIYAFKAIKPALNFVEWDDAK